MCDSQADCQVISLFMSQVCADATLVFPLLVGETFARYHHSGKIEN